MLFILDCHTWWISVLCACISLSTKNCMSQTASFMQWLVHMYSASIIDNATIGCFLAIPRNDSHVNEKHEPYGGSLIVCIFHPIRITTSFQGNILPFEVYFEVQSALQVPYDAIHSHPMRWTDLQHELAHRTHRKCNIGPRSHHCIHERTYFGLV